MNCSLLQCVQKKFVIFLQKRLKFNAWHMISYEERPYAQWVVRWVNRKATQNDLRVVEIGCGLGEILYHIDSKNKEGYDVEKAVIRAGKIIYRQKLFVGSFDSLVHRKIDVLIAVNFLHALEPEYVKQSFDYVISNNDINFIIVDWVDSPLYKYSHNYDEILRGYGYKLYTKSRGFRVDNGRRYIYIFKK